MRIQNSLKGIYVKEEEKLNNGKFEFEKAKQDNSFLPEDQQELKDEMDDIVNENYLLDLKNKQSIGDGDD